jgi:polysaccharide biosynthesis/export protein
MKFIRLLLLLVFPAYFFSCKPIQKIPNYLENITDTTGQGEIKTPDLKIQKNDLLSIQIISLSLNPEKSDVPYNQPSVGGSAEGGAPGYLVDNNGDIIHHRLGVMHVEGLTKSELATEIKKRLQAPVELLKDPTVIIRINNFKVTVLGQVGREGVLNVPGERLTVLEAIGLAGGITEFGKKSNLKIHREADGKRETGIIDLTSKDIFDSPYYYLRQNDVLIIEPTNQRYKEAEQTRVIQKISFAFTLVTVAATIASIFIRN